MASVWELILQHSVNEIQNPEYGSYTDKESARPYPQMQNFIVHTTVGHGGLVHANFDPVFLLRRREAL